MNQVISGFLSLNTRERWKTFLMAVLGAVLMYIWGVVKPMWDAGHIDFAFLWTSLQNWVPIVKAAALAAGAYFSGTGLSNEDGKFLKK